MAPRTLCLGLLLLAACSGGKNRETSRDLGNSGRDAQADAADDERLDENDAEAERDAAERDAAPVTPLDATPEPGDASADTGLDATAPLDGAPGDAALDGTAPADAADADATSDGEPDAAVDADVQPPDGSYIRVSVDNPRGHENPIQFAWGSPSLGPDPNGFVRGFSQSAALDVIMGEGDETQSLRFLDVRSGDHLHFLYRHFRDQRAFRVVVFPPGAKPDGTLQLQIGQSGGLLATDSMGSAEFYTNGTSDYLALALGMSAQTASVLGYAFVKDVPFAFTPVMLTQWRVPLHVPVSIANAPAEAQPSLIVRNRHDQSFPAGVGPQGETFVVPPDFAEQLEARVVYTSVEGETVVSRLVARCAPGTTPSFVLDYADALPASTLGFSALDGTVTWTFTDPGPGLRGDLLFFDGIFMPATQTTLSIPGGNVSGAHYLLRVDLGSAADYQELKQTMRFDLGVLTGLGRGAAEGVLNTLQLCHGTDSLRATLVQLSSQDEI